MNMTFDQLREIKHSLPSGSISRIADTLNLDEQTVRNYFGARKPDGSMPGHHLQPGPEGGVINLDQNAKILDLALEIINQPGRK